MKRALYRLEERSASLVSQIEHTQGGNPPPPAPPCENRKINAMRRKWNDLTLLERLALVEAVQNIGWTFSDGQVSFNDRKMLIYRAMSLMNAIRKQPLKLGN